MPSLIATLMSIGLMSIMMLSYVDYSNPSQIVYRQVEAQITDGFSSVEESWHSYRVANQVNEWVCETHTTAEGTYEDCNKVITDPGYLAPGIGWDTNLFPAHGFKPRFPVQDILSYGSTADGYFFCLDAGFSAVHIPGVKRSMASIPADKLIVNTSCGTTAQTDIDTLAPSSVLLTYWVLRNN